MSMKVQRNDHGDGYPISLIDYNDERAITEDDARRLRDALTDVIGDRVLVFVFDDGDLSTFEPFQSIPQANAFEKGISEYCDDVKTLRWPFDEDEIIEACDPEDPDEMLAKCIERGIPFGLEPVT